MVLNMRVEGTVVQVSGDMETAWSAHVAPWQVEQEMAQEAVHRESLSSLNLEHLIPIRTNAT